MCCNRAGENTLGRAIADIRYCATKRRNRIAILSSEMQGFSLGCLDNVSDEALPALVMHAEGNFQFDDPLSRILVSGAMGVSMLSGMDSATPVAPLAVRTFIDWTRKLQCVIDPMGPASCAVPV